MSGEETMGRLSRLDPASGEDPPDHSVESVLAATHGVNARTRRAPTRLPFVAAAAALIAALSWGLPRLGGETPTVSPIAVTGDEDKIEQTTLTTLIRTSTTMTTTIPTTSSSNDGTAPSDEVTVPSDEATPRSVRINFDEPAPPGEPWHVDHPERGAIDGPFQGVDFASGWRWEAAFGTGTDLSNRIVLVDVADQRGTLGFGDDGGVLSQLTVWTRNNGNLTISDENGQTIQRSIEAGTNTVVDTGWTERSSAATISWSRDTKFTIDDIIVTLDR